MPMLNRFALVSLAAFALAVIAACGGGDDGDDAFELPPPGEYRFAVTGTVEIEFTEPGVSAGSIALQEAETGEASGELTFELLEDGTFVISAPDGVLMQIEEVTRSPVTITQNEDTSSNGAITSDGMVWTLGVGAMLPSGEVLTGQAPFEFELEGDGNPFTDNNPPYGFNPPPGWGPVPFTDSTGNDLFIINDVALDLTLVNGPPVDEDEELSDEDFEATTEAEFDALEFELGACDDCWSFPDPEGDDVFCGTEELANNPTVDIVRVNFFESGGVYWMEVFPAASPADAFDNDDSWSTGGSLGGRMAIAEAHNNVLRVGLLDPDGGDFAPLVPGSAERVIIGDESVSFGFPPEANVPGAPWNVETFNLKVDGEDEVSCDTAEGTLP